MLHNYLTAILRHIRKRRVSSLINIAGLAVGLASSMLILLYVRHELSYDRYQEKADRIFRLTRPYDYPSGYNQHFARVPDNWINELPQAIPGIERLLRLQEFRTAHIRIGEVKFREAHAFATIAIFIAAQGILGLAAIAANQRRKEIGIRKVLGASAYQIVSCLAENSLSSLFWLTLVLLC